MTTVFMTIVGEAKALCRVLLMQVQLNASAASTSMSIGWAVFYFSAAHLAIRDLKISLVSFK